MQETPSIQIFHGTLFGQSLTRLASSRCKPSDFAKVQQKILGAHVAVEQVGQVGERHALADLRLRPEPDLLVVVGVGGDAGSQLFLHFVHLFTYLIAATSFSPA